MATSWPNQVAIVSVSYLDLSVAGNTIVKSTKSSELAIWIRGITFVMSLLRHQLGKALACFVSLICTAPLKWILAHIYLCGLWPVITRYTPSWVTQFLRSFNVFVYLFRQFGSICGTVNLASTCCNFLSRKPKWVTSDPKKEFRTKCGTITVYSDMIS